ncbi:MAG TPA: RloB family protein [Isosphaeraceae bacterium]|nr:RloB family protein [Isosphaeraceae bacterium]
MSNGKKPRKPLSPKVVALNQQLERRRGVRQLAKRFLIVCEDGKSAPSYFEALKKHFNLSATSVKVAGSDGNSQPIQVVQRAVELKTSAASTDSGTEPFAQVWCVIDGDYGEKIKNARAKATARGVKLAISTKCFEYWVLLHFEESDTASIDCDALVSSLKRKHLPKYEKGKCKFDDIVKDVRNACKRAEKLRQPGIARGELPEIQNPCSEVYKLVNAILTVRDLSKQE